jgi:hypothetical protein
VRPVPAGNFAPRRSSGKIPENSDWRGPPRDGSSVNEVVPHAKLLERPGTIADHIMTQPRTTGRMTTQIVRRPWRRQITDSLEGGFAMQMFAHLAKKTAAHGRGHIGDAVAQVRKGKRDNFD